MSVYAALGAIIAGLGAVETVERDRYALFRSVRIFADAVIMADAVRIAIHLIRRVDHPIFVRVRSDRNKVTHVAKLRTTSDVQTIAPYVREAYVCSVQDR